MKITTHAHLRAMARLAFYAPAIAAAWPVLAQENAGTEVADATQLTEVTVTAERDARKIGLTDKIEGVPGQTYVIDRAAVEALPFSDATDLLRQTPGITLGPSSPTGDIGDDISIRGFSSYHGADSATYIDGVPVNAPNSPNRHGAADFNWLTPDLIDHIEIIKGPFSALYGNFNLAGAINIVTKSSDKSSVSAEGGSYDNYSGSAVYGREFKGITPFIDVNYLDRDGYRDHSDYRRINTFNKFTFPVQDGNLSLRINGSFRDYQGAGFLSVDDVRDGSVDRRSAATGALLDHGKNDYYTFVANYIPKGPTGITATGYAGHDNFAFFDSSFNSPTASPDPNDPTYEPQSFETYSRTYAGWRIQQTSNTWWNKRILLTVGSDGQFDDGTVITGNTLVLGDPAAGTAVATGQIDRNVDDQRRNQQTQSIQAGVFAQTQVLLHPTFKLVGGLRFDYFSTDVINNRFIGQVVDNTFVSNSGQHDESTLTPKIGAVYTPIRQLEFFSNYGGGFRSAAATELSQNRAGATFNNSLGVAKLDSVDAGVNAYLPFGLKLSGAAFTTETRRELRRGANANNSFDVVNVGTTQRDGFEVSIEWQPLSNIRFQASHVGVDAKIKHVAVPGADRVITVPDDTQTFSASWFGTVAGRYRLNADFFGQREGRRPLAADGSVYDNGFILYGLTGRASVGRITATLGVQYAPDRYTSDFVFLNGPVIFDPRPLLNFTGGLKYTFD